MKTTILFVIKQNSQMWRLYPSLLLQASSSVLCTRADANSVQVDCHDLALVVIDLASFPEADWQGVLRAWTIQCGPEKILVINSSDGLSDLTEAETVLALELQIDRVRKPREVFPKTLLSAAGLVSEEERLSCFPPLPKSSEATLLLSGNIQLDTYQRKCILDDSPVNLTRLEFTLLEFLMRNPGYPFTRDALISHLYGREYGGYNRNIDPLVFRIRQKLRLRDQLTGAFLKLINHHGVGYGWDRNEPVLYEYSPLHKATRLPSHHEQCVSEKTLRAQATLLTTTVLSVDTVRREVTHHGQQLELTSKEFQILELLMRSPGVPQSRHQIAVQLYGVVDYDGYDRNIDPHVGRLRMKLGDKQNTGSHTDEVILTVWGIGYKLNPKLSVTFGQSPVVDI